MGFFNWLRGKPPSTVVPQACLAADQAKFPLKAVGVESDSGPRLYSTLAARLPADVRKLFESGSIAIGEIGILTPNALIYSVPPSGYVIHVYTGLSRLLYRVSRALHSNVRVFSGPAGLDVQQPTQSQEEIAHIIETIFRNFMDNGKIGGPSGYPISPEQIEVASNLVTHAETFAIAHEIAHAVVWRAKGSALKKLNPADEVEADKLALMFVLGIAGEPGAMLNLSPRMIYAGAEFLLRVLACLEHLGYPFKETHPLPSNRLANLRNVMMELTMGRRGFIRESTIAFAHDQLLEDVERRFAGPGRANFVLGATPERLLSTFSVLIEECVRGRLTLDFVLTEASRLFAGAPVGSVQRVASDAAGMYFREPLINPSDDDMNFALRERELFKTIAENMPNPWREIFQGVIPSVSGPVPWITVSAPGDSQHPSDSSRGFNSLH